MLMGGLEVLASWRWRRSMEGAEVWMGLLRCVS